MTRITGERDGLNHRVVRRETDRRIVWTACGKRLAAIGQLRHFSPGVCPRCGS